MNFTSPKLLIMLTCVYNKSYIHLLLLLLITFSFNCSAQLTVTSGSTSALLAAKLAGPGITIVSDTLICNSGANGTFVSVSTPIVLDSGIILSSGLASACAGPESPVTSTSFSGSGDNDLNTLISGGSNRDACALIIHFVPKGDTVSFDYQFGSEEYRQATCGPYNDAFGFFIAGPGVSSTYPGVNMALVPGTTIPVAVNSVNSGVTGSCGGCTFSNCTAMGTGSPFTTFYVNNTGGTSVSYRGYTTRFTAKHWVRPCDTYRIKMVIADGGTASSPNYIYDSGVFIAAGSLRTNSYRFDRPSIGHTILGFPNAIVKGCGPDSIKIKSSRASGTPVVLRLAYSGTATPGVDYTALPDSVTMRAGDTSLSFPVTGLPTSTTGAKTIVIRLTTASVCGLVDSITVNVLDHPTVTILTNDTTVCKGSPLTLSATTSTGVNFNWTPATFLSSTTILNPVSTPTTTITYTLTGTLPGSVCPPFSETVTVTVVQPNVTILTPDTTVCQGASFQIRVAGPDSLLYAWSPPTQLNSAGIKQPTYTAQSTVTYTVTASIMGTTCNTQKQITITVIPTDFVISVHDTFFCVGATMVLNGTVTPPASTYTYLWTGPGGYTSALLNPVITTITLANAGIYTLKVTNSGLCDVTANEKITVYPSPSAEIFYPPIEYCQYAIPQVLSVPGYDNLMWYSSSADTTPSVHAPKPGTDSIGKFQYWAAQISYKNNCLSQKISIDVTIRQCCVGTPFVPSAFTPNADGINDVLRVVRSSDYAMSAFAVYNRWGVLMFQSSGESQGWDGTYNGQPADIGTYYYVAILSCKSSDKQNITLKGDVTLVR